MRAIDWLCQSSALALDEPPIFNFIRYVYNIEIFMIDLMFVV